MPSSPCPRRILLAVTGLSPQVVTESLYALAVTAQPAWIPHEIHLITTREGAERARLSLLSSDPGWFARLRQDYRLPPIAFDDSHIHVIADASGQPLDDIRTPQDNEAAADRISALVRELTHDPASELHVSIAGGRKTMGYYLGYALSLFGRPQDRLSHVLVSEPFESSWQFFYPTPSERIIPVKGDKLADCRDAQVTLAEIPFVRLREGLPERLLRGEARFSDAVGAANMALRKPHLRLVRNASKAYADGIDLELSPTEFAFLLWFALRAQCDAPEIDWSQPHEAEEFLALAKSVLNPASGEYVRLEGALRWRLGDPKALGEYFEPQKSRVRKAFEMALGAHAADRYQIRRIGKRGASRYYLPLEENQIEICS